MAALDSNQEPPPNQGGLYLAYAFELAGRMDGEGIAPTRSDFQSGALLIELSVRDTFIIPH